jgi:hypothetical protein
MPSAAQIAAYQAAVTQKAAMIIKERKAHDLLGTGAWIKKPVEFMSEGRIMELSKKGNEQSEQKKLENQKKLEETKRKNE